MQTTSYRLPLSNQAELLVWFVTERGAVISYSVVLVAQHQGAWHTIRVYDNAHGRNEVHRHTLAGGKQPAEPFSPASSARRCAPPGARSLPDTRRWLRHGGASQPLHRGRRASRPAF